MMQLTDQKTTETTGVEYRQYQGGYFKVLISPEETNGAMALIEMTLPRGVEPPPHIHTREDETFYLLEGEMVFQVEDKETIAKPGDAVFFPRMVRHRFEIKTPSAKFLTLITPGNFLDYFIEFSEPLASPLQLIHPQAPPPADFIERMTMQLKDHYGLQLI